MSSTECATTIFLFHSMTLPTGSFVVGLTLWTVIFPAQIDGYTTLDTLLPMLPRMWDELNPSWSLNTIISNALSRVPGRHERQSSQALTDRGIIHLMELDKPKREYGPYEHRIEALGSNVTLEWIQKCKDLGQVSCGGSHRWTTYMPSLLGTPGHTCELIPCTESIICTNDIYICPISRRILERSSNLNCEFPSCGETETKFMPSGFRSSTPECTRDRLPCPDGTWTERNPARNCDFRPCAQIKRKLGFWKFLKRKPKTSPKGTFGRKANKAYGAPMLSDILYRRTTSRIYQTYLASANGKAWKRQHDSKQTRNQKTSGYLENWKRRFRVFS